MTIQLVSFFSVIAGEMLVLDIFFLLTVLSIPVMPFSSDVSRRREERKRNEIPEQPPQEDKPSNSKKIPVLQSSSVKAHLRITDEMARVVGNVSIPDGQEIKENMVIHGDLTLGSKCHVHGGLNVFGEVKVGEDSIVEGHILAERRVFIGRNVKVAGIVDSVEDVVLGENAEVEAVCTEKSVTLASGTKISLKVLAGESLLTKSSSAKKVETEQLIERKPQGDAAQPTISPFDAFFEEEETEETIDEKSRLFKSLEERIERLDSLVDRGVDESIIPPQQLEGLSVDEVFEAMLASKIRSEIKEKIRREAEERETLTNLLSELSRKPRIIDEERPKEETEAPKARPKALTGFPMKVFGEIFQAGEGATAVIGDVEIPNGSIVNKPLVVKGKLNIGADCRILGNLKALGGISIADGCSAKASIASGDVIEIGGNTIIEGDVHAESSIKLSEGARIYGLVDAGGSYVSIENLRSEASSGGQEKNVR